MLLHLKYNEVKNLSGCVNISKICKTNEYLCTIQMINERLNKIFYC